MTTYDLTLTPTTVAVELRANTAVYASALTGSAQTLDRQAFKWRLQYTYNNLRTDNRATMLALIASLRGQSNRLRVPVHDNPARGSYGGTPLVDGASQTGNTLTVDGCSLSVTNWIRAGDYFSVIVNGEPELKMATADASSDGAGDITLTFEPKLRASPDNNAAIYVEDGVLSTPKGIFMQSEAATGWTSVAWSNGQLTSVTLDLIEDVFGTQ